MTPALSDRIDQMAKAQIHAGRTPGLAIGIVEDGRIVYARGFGFADLSKHVPMTPDTQFYAGGLDPAVYRRRHSAARARR